MPSILYPGIGKEVKLSKTFAISRIQKSIYLIPTAYLHSWKVKKRKALFFNRHNDKYFMSRLAPPWQLFLRVLACYPSCKKFRFLVF
ncbi:hypothetical protein DB41_EH00110 [Neochlamydia sp. TUME1]|nr:hypothetical protein DB41_EH00110 [Neochlamydia sp. TUME1]